MFPSSTNSSTLSESTSSRLDSPCRSPDCPAAPDAVPLREKAVPGLFVLRLVVAFLRGGCFLTTGFFVADFLVDDLVFAAGAVFDFERFLVAFFLADISAVYHRRICLRKTCACRGLKMSSCKSVEAEDRLMASNSQAVKTCLPAEEDEWKNVGWEIRVWR